MYLELVDLRDSDFELVKRIYDHYILNSTATFHTQEITTAELKEIMPVGHPRYRSFLIKRDGETCGYCYIGQYKKRQAYDRTAEITIYLKPELTGQDIGSEVVRQLEVLAAKSGIAVLLAGITGDNARSIRLFEKCGYEKCAHFRQVGEKFNKILDVVVYEKILR